VKSLILTALLSRRRPLRERWLPAVCWRLVSSRYRFDIGRAALWLWLYEPRVPCHADVARHLNSADTRCWRLMPTIGVCGRVYSPSCRSNVDAWRSVEIAAAKAVFKCTSVLIFRSVCGRCNTPFYLLSV